MLDYQYSIHTKKFIPWKHVIHAFLLHEAIRSIVLIWDFVRHQEQQVDTWNPKPETHWKKQKRPRNFKRNHAKNTVKHHCYWTTIWSCLPKMREPTLQAGRHHKDMSDYLSESTHRKKLQLPIGKHIKEDNCLHKGEFFLFTIKWKKRFTFHASKTRCMTQTIGRKFWLFE